MSSANASILSASRAIYALSNDALLPEKAARLNRRYSTPHIALLLAGGPIIVLVLFGPVEILAEVASFLHLVMYGLICLVLIKLRRTDPDWYDPAFRAPGYPVLPAIGALASFSLIGFMARASQLIGLLVLVVAVGWYLAYGRGVSLQGAHE